MERGGVGSQRQPPLHLHSDRAAGRQAIGGLNDGSEELAKIEIDRDELPALDVRPGLGQQTVDSIGQVVAAADDHVEQLLPLGVVE